MSNFKGKTALITGASSGMGADFARQLAAEGCNLILVARRIGHLEALRAEIQLRHPVQIQLLARDLSTVEAGAELFEETEALELQVDILVNNAGCGQSGNFLDVDDQREQDMLMLNIFTLTRLSKLYGQQMAARGSGHILLVASVAAFQPMPTLAAYGASKAYVLSLGEAMAFELKDRGVVVTTLCPGGVLTEFPAAAGQQLSAMHERGMMQSPDVVAEALKALHKGEPLVVPGLMNQVSVFANRLMPRKLAPRVINLIMASTMPT